MRLLTIYHHFAINSKMACRSGSRTSWIAIRALQCYLRHLAHAWGGTTWHQTYVDKPARSWKLLFFRPLGSLGCLNKIVSSRASLRIPGAYESVWINYECFSRCHCDLVRILYHQTERFSWWTPMLRREAIQGFFKGKLLDPTAEFDGKQLPWTLVDYVAQTGKDCNMENFCALLEGWIRLACFRTIGKQFSATSTCLHQRCHQLNPVNSDQEPFSSLFKFSVTLAISWTRFRFQMINKTQLEFFYQKSTPKCTFFGNFLRHQLQHHKCDFCQWGGSSNLRICRMEDWSEASIGTRLWLQLVSMFFLFFDLGQIDPWIRMIRDSDNLGWN